MRIENLKKGVTGAGPVSPRVVDKNIIDNRQTDTPTQLPSSSHAFSDYHIVQIVPRENEGVRTPFDLLHISYSSQNKKPSAKQSGAPA